MSKYLDKFQLELVTDYKHNLKQLERYQNTLADIQSEIDDQLYIIKKLGIDNLINEDIGV